MGTNMSARYIMAFITSFFFGFTLILGCVSLACLVASAVLLIVFAKKRSKASRVIKIISTVVLCLSLAGMLPIATVMGISLLQSMTAPDDFVDLSVTVEFTEEGFVTSDGGSFKLLPYFLGDVQEKEACFSVKPEGLFGKEGWGNVYKFVSLGNELYYYISQEGEGMIYCRAEDYDRSRASIESNSVWEAGGKGACSGDAVGIIEKYKSMYGARELAANMDSENIVEISRMTSDGCIMLDGCRLIEYSGKIYILTHFIYDEYYYHSYGFELSRTEANIIRAEFFSANE